jgi:hypothetical protein
MEFLVPASFLTDLTVQYQHSSQHHMIKLSASDLTLLQYQNDEHPVHRFEEAIFLLHPWQVLIPSTFVENCCTSSFNSSNFFSDTGKIFVRAYYVSNLHKALL